MNCPFLVTEAQTERVVLHFLNIKVYFILSSLPINFFFVFPSTWKISLTQKSGVMITPFHHQRDVMRYFFRYFKILLAYYLSELITPSSQEGSTHKKEGLFHYTSYPLRWNMWNFLKIRNCLPFLWCDLFVPRAFLF